MALFRIPLDLYGKICFYFGLIIYHATDIYVDWSVYKELPSENSLIENDTNTTGTIFLASCIGGTLTSIIIILIYGYYIKFHRDFLPSRNRIQSEPCEINQRVITMELTTSLCELFYKELIHSSILFIAFDSDKHPSCVSETTKAFVACCIFGNIKLFVCFYTKLCGIGVGEEIKSIIKSIVCVVGCSGALLGLCFTSLYHANIKNLTLCPEM